MSDEERVVEEKKIKSDFENLSSERVSEKKKKHSGNGNLIILGVVHK